jgi:hypothetical protein
MKYFGKAVMINNSKAYCHNKNKALKKAKVK